MSGVGEWVAQWKAQNDRVEAELRAEFFSENPTVIPNLDPMPDCSICGRVVDYDEGFFCDGCEVRWDRNGERGERDQ